VTLDPPLLGDGEFFRSIFSAFEKQIERGQKGQQRFCFIYEKE